MAENISSVGSGKDYSDLITWEAAKQSTIAAGDQEVAEIYGVISGSVLTGIVGWDMGDADSRIIIRNATGEKHTGTAGTGAGMTLTGAGSSSLIYIQQSTGAMHLTIEGLDFSSNNSGYSGALVVVQNSVVGELLDVLFDSCLMHGVAPATGVSVAVSIADFANAAAIVEARNCVVYDFYHGFAGLNGKETQFITNYCTVHKTTQVSYYRVKPTDCIGTVVQTLGSYFDVGAGGNYNVASDATAPGANSVQSKTTYTDYYTSPAGFDFSLKDTTSAAGIFGQAGTPIGGITVDILGNTRDGTNPDIGAFEYAPIVTPVTTNVAADPTNPAKGATFELSADLDTIGETITAAEWWTGSDLGPGNNNAMDLGAGTTSLEATDTVDTTSLALGSNVFWVRGESASGWGDDASVAVSVIVPQPQNVAAEGGDTTVTVTWDDVDYEESYTLFWDTSSPVTIVGSNQITGIAAGSTSYEHTGRTNGVEYFYAVRAIASAAASLLSSEVSAVAGASAGGGGPLGSKFSKFLN